MHLLFFACDRSAAGIYVSTGHILSTAVCTMVLLRTVGQILTLTCGHRYEPEIWILLFSVHLEIIKPVVLDREVAFSLFDDCIIRHPSQFTSTRYNRTKKYLIRIKGNCRCQKNYFDILYRSSVHATLRNIFESRRYINKSQTAKVVLWYSAHMLCMRKYNCIDPPRATSSSTSSPLSCEVPKVVNGEYNSPKNLCICVW